MRENGPGGLTALVREALKRVNAYSLKLHGHREQAPGWPDFFVAHSRIPRGVWIELKAGGGQLSGTQRRVFRELSRRGTPVLILEERDGMLIAYEQDDEDAAILTRCLADETPSDIGRCIVLHCTQRLGE